MSEMKAWRKEKRDGAGVSYFVLNLGGGAVHELPEAVIDEVLALEERVRAAEQNYKFLDGISKVLHDEADAEKADLKAQLAASEERAAIAEGAMRVLRRQLATSESARQAVEEALTDAFSQWQAAEGRAAELEKVANVMRPSREIAAAKAALMDWIAEDLRVVQEDAVGALPWAFSPRERDYLARYDALLSSPVPAARDGGAEA